MKITTAIGNFINSRAKAIKIYNPCMEVQINVRTDIGEKVEGIYKGKKWFGYSDGNFTWKPIRIPLKANTTSPEFDFDRQLQWPLDKYAEGIGCTGWDFVY